MTSEELSEWMAFEQFAGPIGLERGDLQAAAQSAAMANLFRDREKTEAATPMDYMMRFTPPEPQSIEEQKAAARAAALTIGGGD